MKLKLYLTATAGLYTPPNSDAFELLEVLNKVAMTDGMYVGDRLANKAVSMISSLMKQAEVLDTDDISVMKTKLWDYYLASHAKVEAAMRERIGKMLADLNEVRLQPVLWPDTQKFPMQVTYTLDQGRYACIAYDALGELGEGNDKWVLFFVTLTPHCRSQKVIGSFTSSGGSFDDNKFRTFLPAMLDWTVGSQG